MAEVGSLLTLSSSFGNIAQEIGVQILISYGPKLLRKILRKFGTKELKARLHFTIVLNFYSRPDYQLVYEIISKELDKNRVKQNGKNLLLLNPKANVVYDYYLSVIPEQDYASILNLLECVNFPFSFLNLEDIAISTSLRASGLRLFLWPTNIPREIDVEKFRLLLEDVYAFHRKLDKALKSYMKKGVLHDFELNLLLELKLSDSTDLQIIRNIFRKIPESTRKQNLFISSDGRSIAVILDDSYIIDQLISCLGG